MKRSIPFVFLVFSASVSADVLSDFREYEAAVAAGAVYSHHCRVELSAQTTIGEKCQSYGEFLERFEVLQDRLLEQYADNTFEELLVDQVSTQRWNTHMINIEKFESNFYFIDQFLY